MAAGVGQELTQMPVQHLEAVTLQRRPLVSFDQDNDVNAYIFLKDQLQQLVGKRL